MLCLQWFNRLMAFLFTIMCASYISDKMWNGSPLRGEDTVEDCALPAVSHRLKNKHVLDDVEGEAVIREGTQKLSLQEGGPLLLQNSLPALITLKRYSAFLKWCPFKKKTKSKWAWELTIVAFCRGGGGGVVVDDSVYGVEADTEMCFSHAGDAVAGVWQQMPKTPLCYE